MVAVAVSGGVLTVKALGQGDTEVTVDPDGDMLTLTATTSDRGVVRPRISGSTVVVRAVAAGQAEVTVTATDTDGASTDQSFKVVVERVTMDFAVHEIAHILGFGLLWPRRGLVQDPSDVNHKADTYFTGTQAIRAFDDAGGRRYSGAKVPVENGGDDAHWRESVLDDEMMTPSLVLGRTNPLSAITLQSFADMGYLIDVSHAQPYRLPSTARVADIAAGAEEQGVEILGYGDDVERGPIMVVDANGKVVNVIGEETARLRRSGPVIRVILKDC